MKRSTNQLLAQGITGGMLAGLVVVVWFLIVDFMAGQPFHTPAALASTLSHHGARAPTSQLVAAYSVIHFGVFACLGVIAAWALDALQLRPALLWGVIFGIVVQEFVFYAGLFLGGVPPSEVVPWRRVVAANLLSGLALMAYLRRAMRADDPLRLGPSKGYPSLTRAVLTGLIGAAAVAVWFFVLDVIAGQPFRTAGALGSVLLLGAAGPADVSVNLGIVAAYTVFHVVAFVAAGMIFVAFAEGIERAPSMLLLGVLAAIVLEAMAFATAALGAQWVMGTIGVGSMFIANMGSSRVDLQACKLEYSIVSPK